MLQYEIAQKLYHEIKEKAVNNSNDAFHSFYNELLKNAVAYAKNYEVI